MTNQANTTYTAGVCNIDVVEVQRRKKAAYFGAIATLALAIISLLNGWSDVVTVIVLLPPSFIAALGWLQAKNTFCADYGLRGKLKQASADTTQDAPAADKVANIKKSLQIIAQAFAASFIVSVLLAVAISAF